MKILIKSFISLALLLLMFSDTLDAQNKIVEESKEPFFHEFSCPYEHINTQRLENDIDYAREKTDYERKYQDAMQGKESSFKALSNDCPSFDGVYRIPTVFHIVHEGATLGTEENPTDATVTTALNETNDRFRHASGLTFSNPYSGIDTQIEFCLAQRDEDGNATTGIIRHSVGAGESYIDVDNGTVTPDDHPYSWDISNYLNIYIITTLEGAAGVYYSGYDAVYINSGGLWSGLMAHELGHYFSLAHTFGAGDGTCPANNDCLDDGDYVCDTPPKAIPGQGGAFCNNPNNSCTTDTNDPSTNNPYRPTSMGGIGDVPDILENYMDYTGGCWAAFTIGQKNRMRFNIENSRPAMLNSDKCTPFTNNDAAISAILTPNDIGCTGGDVILTLTNTGGTILTSTTITVELDGGVIITYNWTGSLAAGASVDVNVGTANFSAGSHNIYAYTSVPNGVTDEYENNDALCVDFIYNLPVTVLENCQDFESGNIGPNWTPTNEDADIPFEITNVTSCGANGSNVLMFDSWNVYALNINQSYTLISVNFDLTNYTNSSFTFDLAYQGSFSNTSSKLDVNVSSDCGQSFNNEYAKSEQNGSPGGLETTFDIGLDDTFVPADCGEWRTETINLSAYDGDQITIQFQVSSDTQFFGQVLYLDNLCVDGEILAGVCADTGDADNDNVCTDVDCDDNDATVTTLDTDGDGVCSDEDCDDNDADLFEGATCDDGDSTTINDQVDANCNCVGTPSTCTGIGDADGDNVCTDVDCDDNDVTVTTLDADGDGVCSDADCVDNDPSIYPGATCDDGDATTTGDAYDANCNCIGTSTVCTDIGDVDGDGVCTDVDCDDNNATITTEDADGDGICSDADCDDNNSNIYSGANCDDGDATTGGDMYDANCNCVGLPLDCEDTPGGTATAGTTCNDGDVTTGNDTWDADCNCVGLPLDCEGTPGGTAITGTTCDDGDATTGDDMYDAACNCIGLPLDCEGTPGGTALPNTACDDANPNSQNDMWTNACECIGELEGCTNFLATNYDPLATIDDGSCIIEGCIDSTASNFNPDATVDDGSCNFDCVLDGEVSQLDEIGIGPLAFYYDNYTVELSNFNGPLTFDWDRTGYVRVELDPNGTLSIVAADATTFSITVTDADGCIYIIDEDGFGVTNNSGDGLGSTTSASLDAVINSIDNDGIGDATGGVDISVSGGSGGYTYAWTGPNGYTATTQDIYNLDSGLYTVIVTDANGQTTTITVWVPLRRTDGRLKTADTDFNYLKAYPNPFSQKTTIELAVAEDTQAQLMIYDMSGKKINTLFNGQLYKGEMNAFNLEANELKSGTYFCHLRTENGISKTYPLLIIK